MNVGGFWLVGHLQVVGGGGGGVSSFCQPLGKFGGHPAENHVYPIIEVALMNLEGVSA